MSESRPFYRAPRKADSVTPFGAAWVGNGWLAATAVLALLLALVGCGGVDGASDDSPGTGISVGTATTGETDESNGTSGGVFDVGPGSGPGGGEGGGKCVPKPTDATLKGRVLAPNLEIPISGALVYVTYADPEPVPDGVYCAECVEIPCDAHFVLTEPDGSFTLPAASGAGQKLIVTKGQFLRAVDLDVEEGDNEIALNESNLPGEWNPEEGMWIPRIAIVDGEKDKIYNLFAKIGLGEATGNGMLVEGTQRFDLYSPSDGGKLLDSLAEMQKYHIIFVPCWSEKGMGTLSEQRLANIRQWVEQGGKWYVTDGAADYLVETFPDYQTLHGQSSSLGHYDTTGTIKDPELLAWLEALPPGLQDIGGGHPNLASLPQIGLRDSWTAIEELPSIIVQDEMGMDVDVGHHVWVEGSCPVCSPSNAARPMTISAQYGCGRMMFSTYHTAENAYAGLTPQELILLYVILEIGVCHDEVPPPAPPVG